MTSTVIKQRMYKQILAPRTVPEPYNLISVKPISIVTELIHALRLHIAELLQMLIRSDHERPDCTVPAQPQLRYPGRVASINAHKRLTLNPTDRLKTTQCNPAL